VRERRGAGVDGTLQDLLDEVLAQVAVAHDAHSLLAGGHRSGG
jgi:hypothetical protein